MLGYDPVERKHTVQYAYEEGDDSDDDDEEDLAGSVSIEPVLDDYMSGDVRIV